MSPLPDLEIILSIIYDSGQQNLQKVLIFNYLTAETTFRRLRKRNAAVWFQKCCIRMIKDFPEKNCGSNSSIFSWRHRYRISFRVSKNIPKLLSHFRNMWRFNSMIPTLRLQFRNWCGFLSMRKIWDGMRHGISPRVFLPTPTTPCFRKHWRAGPLIWWVVCCRVTWKSFTK